MKKQKKNKIKNIIVFILGKAKNLLICIAVLYSFLLLGDELEGVPVVVDLLLRLLALYNIHCFAKANHLYYKD